jgi:hypothetical protein
MINFSDVGRTLAHLTYHSKTIYRQIAKCNKDITMKICVHGFGKDDPTDSKVDPTQHLSIHQNITAITGYGRDAVMGDYQNKPTNTTTLPDGKAPIEIFSMEAKLNAEEFLKVDTLKCDGKSHLMARHGDIWVHGRMWGVSIPPSFSLSQNTLSRPSGTSLTSGRLFIRHTTPRQATIKPLHVCKICFGQHHA